ncbi:MAG TPA: RNA methyltransferase [Candidatus Desulfaltia sp.]|nr:RNA methyltransferase [Candidatus Desulfaltia sp.]
MTRKTWKNNVHFILVGPTEPGNIGAAARAIKNMGFRRLGLVAPVPYLTGEARSMACHAKDVLEAARVYKSFRRAIAGKALVVGTTGRLGGKRGLILDVRRGAPRIRKATTTNQVAILFGNEHNGLTSRQLDECGLVLTIPSSPAFPSLNLSQSVMIVAYELSRLEAKTKSPVLVETKELQKLYRRFPRTLQLLGYGRKGDKDLKTEIGRNLKHLFGRAGLTEWELNMLLGLCTRVERELHRKE